MRRALRSVAAVLLALVGAAALLVGSTLSVLRTERGAGLARRIALPRVNAAIAGTLGIGSLKYGGDRLTLHDVSLHDPEGLQVAQVGKIDVVFSPLALLAGRVRVRGLDVVQPSLWLRQDAAGLNLARALASRGSSRAAPSPPAVEPSGAGPIIDVAALRLSGGAVEFRSAAGNVPRVVRLIDLVVRGNGRYEPGAGVFKMSAQLEAAMSEPVREAVSLRMTADGSGQRRNVDVGASLGGAALTAILHTEGGEQLSLRLSRLHLTPIVVRAFAPAVRLRVPIDATADVARAGDTLTFNAGVEAGGGSLEVSGTVDVARARVGDLTAVARGVDLGAVIEGLPRSNLSMRARGAGDGSNWRTADGNVSLEIPAGTLGGANLGPISVRVTASDGHYQLEQLRIVAPGVVLRGQGVAGPERLALAFELDASDLSATSRTVAAFADVEAPALAGRGEARLSVAGTVPVPKVSISARFPRLSVAGNKVFGLALSAHVPNARTPEIASADLRAANVRLSGHTTGPVRVQIQSTPRALTAAVRTAGDTPTSLSLAGVWGRGRRAFTLQKLTLGWPGAHWAQLGEARFVFEPNRLAVAGLDLRAGDQRVRLDVDKSGRRLRGAVTVERFDLAKLPPYALPAALGVAGRLDLRADLAGTTDRPQARATVSLSGGRLGRYRGLALTLDARYAAGRASGELDAQGLGSSVKARFDLPTIWPPPDGRSPLSLDLTMPPTDLRGLLTAAHLPVSVSSKVAGQVALSMEVRGTAAAPSLNLAATTHRLVVHDQAIGDTTLNVAGDPRTPISVALVVHAPNGAPLPASRARTPLVRDGRLTVQTDLSLASLIRRPPTRDELVGAHFDIRGDLRGVPLAAIGRMTQSPLLSSGTASLRISAEGTALAPQGALNIELVGAAGPRFPPTDARLDATFGAKDTRVALRVRRRGLELASASAVLGLSSRRLSDRAALAAAPLTARLAVGPLRVRRDAVPGSLAPHLSHALSAIARATASVDGTLNDPRLQVTAEVSDATLGTKPVGAARGVLTYADRRANVDVQLRSVGGGGLTLGAQSPVDLGYGSLRHGLQVAALPIQATLTAQRFELGWLSGITPQVAHVAGHLLASVSARGTVGRPIVKGQLEWSDGALTLTGLGAYRDLHLRAHGDDKALWLDELRVASGNGTARLTASASRRGGVGFDLRATAKLQRFPIYGQGQALAVVSADASVSGSTSGDGLRASTKIGEAQVELTDAKQKDLQPLSRPADVILMEDGKPIDPAEARKLASALARLPDAAGPETAALAASPRDPDDKPFLAVLVVEAPRNLWVRGKDASLELGLGPDFRVESGDRLRVFGQVLVRRGRIGVLGRRFNLQGGSMVRFIGPPDAPRLDVTAKYVNETENITVILSAKGPLDQLALTVTSPDRPDLTEGQLYTLIVTGRLQLGGNAAGSASASAQAASLVGGLVAAQLQKTLARRLPLDVLTIQAGQGLAGSRLEAGTYLTSKLYAGYVGRVGANPALLQNRNAVHVEYQLTRRWSFDAEYGDVGTGTADLFWTKHY